MVERHFRSLREATAPPVSEFAAERCEPLARKFMIRLPNSREVVSHETLIKCIRAHQDQMLFALAPELLLRSRSLRPNLRLARNLRVAGTTSVPTFEVVVGIVVTRRICGCSGLSAHAAASARHLLGSSMRYSSYPTSIIRSAVRLGLE